MSWILILAHLTIIEITPLVATKIVSIETNSNNMKIAHLAQDAVIKKASRRSFMIRCCGSQSCRGPNYPRNTFARTTTTTRNPLAVFQYQRPRRGRPVAVAEFSEDGFAISCPNCPLNWQELLSFIPAPPGAIPLICPYCPTEWRDLLQIKPQTTTQEKRKKTTKASDDEEDTTDTDSTDTDGTEKAEKVVIVTKAVTVTTTTTVKIATTLAPTTSTVTSTTTTAAATTAGGGGGILGGGGLGGLLNNVLGGGGNKPKGTKPPTTQPSFDSYGFKLD